MTKPQNPRNKPPAVTKPERDPTRHSKLGAPTRNSKLGAQTRKVLTKHYRAKHGVR
jgi:hypothetical protein